MAHNPRQRPDAAWVIDGSPWATDEFTALDTALSKALNGDGGGVFTPAANIVIGGAGIRLIAVRHNWSGTGAGIQTDVDHPIVHNDSDYVGFDSGHPLPTETRVTPALLGVAPTYWSGGAGLGFCIVSQGSGLAVTAAANAGAKAWVPLRVHDGAELAGAVFTFSVPTAAGGVPAFMPKFRIVAVDLQTGAVTPLLTNTQSGYLPFTPRPANGTAWHAGGAAQTFTYACDTFADNVAVLVDVSRYAYFGEIVDQVYPGGVVDQPLRYYDVACAFAEIADFRPM
jgi:hypothetical protein